MAKKKAKRALASYFVNATRTDGATFTKCTDDAPEWLTEAIQEAHGGDFQDDWIYLECRDACAAYDDGALSLSEDGDDVHEYADSAVDIYTKDRYQWATDHCLGSLFANAESEADDLGPSEDTTARLGVVQYCAIRAIASTMLEAIRASKGGK
jgi:hypothetical protein